MSAFHTPVLVDEVIAGVNVRPGKRYIDATVGGGGHGWEIVKRGGSLLGIDQDWEAVEFVREKLKAQSSKIKNKIGDWKVVQGNFRNIETIAKENGFGCVDGVLFDLGVSSHQLDTPERGFSWRWREAALDMRMNPEQGVRAADIVGSASEEELYEIFSKLGEEELARPIAHALVGARRLMPIARSADLVAMVQQAVPKRLHQKAFARVFQALRIAVNDELEALRSGLAGALNILDRGGRVAVISFHSLEDRMVKAFFSQHAMRILTKHPIRPGVQEIRENPRAKSAKLRIAAKL